LKLFEELIFGTLFKVSGLSFWETLVFP